MTKPKRPLSVGFLFDDTLDSNDGVAQYVKNLGRWLSGQGHHVFYLSGETSLKSWAGGPVYSLSKNIGVKFNGNNVSTPLPASRQGIRKILAKEKPDILHVQMPYSPFMAGRVIKAASPGTAIIGTFHIFPAGIAAKVGSKLLKLFCLHSLKRFDNVLAVSPAAAEFAAWAFGLKTIASSNVVELDRYSAAAVKRQPKNQIIFLGRLVKRKGCEELLRAFILLKASLPEAMLIIAGGGPERQRLERLVEQNGLRSSVIFLGFVDENDKPALLASADVACFPSLYGESFGIVLIEAMAAGAGVVVGGNNPGYKTVLRDRPQLLVDPNKPAVFARKLVDLLTNKAMAESLHAWQAGEIKKYDVSVVGSQLLKVYAKAIAKAREGRHN